MKKHLIVMLLASSALCLLKAEESFDRTTLLQTLVERNPDVRAAYRKWQVTRFDAAGSSAWPNPTVSYIEEKDPSGATDVAPLERHHLNFQQAIPFPGKLSNETRMKHHEALIAEENFNRVRLEISKQLTVKMAALGRVQTLEKLATEARQTMQAMLGSARGRLTTGRATTAETLLLESEVARLENAKYSREQEIRLGEIELNTLLDWPLDKRWPDIAETMENPLPNLEKVQEYAERQSPLIRTAAHERNHARAMLQRNRLDYAPDMGLMYEYQTAGPGFSGVGKSGQQLGVSLSVPLWLSRPNSAVRAGREHQQEAEATTRAMINMVRKMVAMEYIETETHRKLAERNASRVVPASRAAWISAREQVAAGRLDVMRFLDITHVWIQSNEELADERYHATEHQAELEMWIGGPLP